MKVAIVGAGSIGCFVGGALCYHAGCDVVLIGRAYLRDEVDRNGGIRLSTLDEEEAVLVDRDRFPLRVATEMTEECLRDRDFVLVTVKAKDTHDVALALAKANVPTTTTIVILQNGVFDMSVVKQELPQHTVLQGMVGFNVVWEKGATFHKGTTNPIVIEKSASSSLSSSDEANAKVNELVRKIKEAGLEVATTTDIMATKWSKLLLNLNNAVQALSGVPLKQELKTRGYRKVFAACQREALQVLNAHHIKTVRIGLLVPSLLPTLLSLPDWLYNLIMPVRISSRAHGSAWEDLERKRTTEIDFLNGEIIRLAKLKGIATPVNERVVALIKEAERKAEGSPRIPPEKLYKLTTGKDLREEEQRQRLFFFVVLLFVAFFVVYKMFF